MAPYFLRAPVAQLDRVPGFEPGCRGFESLRARQANQAPAVAWMEPRFARRNPGIPLIP